MPAAATTWARESARLAYFAVAMSERRDEALLLLYEQTNNALESYLKATDAKPPRLGNLPGPPPSQPLPSIPQRTSSRRRPLSIMGSVPVAPKTPPEPKSAWSEPSSALTRESSSDVSALPTQEACRQFCVAFAAVDNQLPRSDFKRYMTWLAMYDVCLGQAVEVAARTRQVPASDLYDALMHMKSVGPKAFLDQALALRLPPGHAL